MARVSPAPAERLAQFAQEFERTAKSRGYVPNNWYVLARKPRIFRALRELRDAVMNDPGEVAPGLRFMVAEVASNAAGCRYCTAHNAENAVVCPKTSCTRCGNFARALYLRPRNGLRSSSRLPPAAARQR